MSKTILQAASSTNLTTKEIVQTQLNFAVGVDDEIFDQLIDAASSFITSYTDRQFAREQWSELVPGYNGNWLQLTLTPIDSVDSVALNGTVFTDFIIEDEESGLLFREKGWESSLSFGRGIEVHPLARSSLPRFKVDYFGGYVLPSFVSGVVNLPGVIQQACVDLVRIWYAQLKDNLPANTKQIKIGDYTISFGDEIPSNGSLLGVPASILAKLRPWRRMI